MPPASLSSVFAPLLTLKMLGIVACATLFSQAVQVMVNWGASRIIAPERSTLRNAAKLALLTIALTLALILGLVSTALLGGFDGLKLAIILALLVAGVTGFFVLPVYVYEINLWEACLFLFVSWLMTAMLGGVVRYATPRLLPASEARQVQAAATSAVSAVSQTVLPDQVNGKSLRVKAAKGGSSGRSVVYEAVLGAADVSDRSELEGHRDPLSGKTVRLTDDVTVDIAIDGVPGGRIQLDRGTRLKVVDGDAATLKVIYLDSEVLVPRAKAALVP